MEKKTRTIGILLLVLLALLITFFGLKKWNTSKSEAEEKKKENAVVHIFETDSLESIEYKEVLIVEDIIDSGNTLYYLIDVLKKRNPASMRLCTLLDKPDRRVKDVKVDYCGFEIPDEFVVGYGLDYAQKYRNLPYIGVVEGVE